jgi:23S rRNA (guanine745-N1)-methyltransferase
MDDGRKIKKKDIAKENIKRNIGRFKCPVCGGPMHLKEYGLSCSLKHSFDISENGYINLLTSSKRPVYPKELFEARHRVLSRGLFDPLIDTLFFVLEKYIDKRNDAFVLDAGCGEGSHLHALYRKTDEKSKITFIGADISKEAIHLAAASAGNILWTVADLTRLPFTDESIDILFNILSPANYPEFERILSEDGIVIKVIPNPQYLKELREALYNQNRYSGDRVAEYFSNHLKVIENRDIRYQFKVDEDLLPDFIRMTPLTWGTKVDEKLDPKDIRIKEITVDLSVLVGRKGKR